MVIQALVFSLFATLFVRLYYLQVVTGDEYHARAADQSVREIVVQPQRGLIVDDQGRPWSPTGARGWSRSTARCSASSPRPAGAAPASSGSPRGRGDRPALTTALVTCGEDGASPGACWNGSPYQPVPVAIDVARRPRCGSSSSPRTTPR